MGIVGEVGAGVEAGELSRLERGVGALALYCALMLAGFEWSRATRHQQTNKLFLHLITWHSLVFTTWGPNSHAIFQQIVIFTSWS